VHPAFTIIPIPLGFPRSFAKKLKDSVNISFNEEVLQEYVMYDQTYPEIQSQIKALVNQIFKDGAVKSCMSLMVPFK